MSEVDFDVIVVGAGIAGSITALLLARGGLSVALLERGEAPGTKNLSGGVLYSQIMTRIMDEFLTRAPVERRIDRNQLCFLNEDSWVGIDYRVERLAVGKVAVTVLRGRLDAWLAEQAEEAGGMMMTSIRVDGVLRDGDRIVGVVADEEEVRSHVVVAADGVNSFLARASGLRDHAAPSQLGVGIKALVQLDEDTITQRFALAPGRGAAFAFVGDCTQGIGGGGFLYTNRSSLSVGLVLRLDALRDSRRHAREVFQHYLGHPHVSRYNAAGYDIRMELAGDKETYSVGFAEYMPITSAEPNFTFAQAGERYPNFYPRFIPAYKAEISAFIEALNTGGEISPTVADALEALYICEALDLSLKENRPVKLSEIR